MCAQGACACVRCSVRVHRVHALQTFGEDETAVAQAASKAPQAVRCSVTRGMHTTGHAVRHCRIGCRRLQRAMAIAHAEVVAIDDARTIA